MSIRGIPDIQIVPVRAQAAALAGLPAATPGVQRPVGLAQKRVDEFLMARAIAPKSHNWLRVLYAIIGNTLR